MIQTWLNKIHHGDCLDLMAKMPAESVDLIVTSPPYNLRNSSGGGMRNGSGGLWENAQLLKGYAGGYEDAMPRDKYVRWQRNCLTAMMRVLKSTGVIFYNHKWRVQNGLLEDQRDIVNGFPIRQIIIWQRPGGVNFNLGYLLPTYEVIYVIPKTEKFRLVNGPKSNPKKACGYGDIWRFAPARGNPHPAPFPVELPKRCIEITGAKVVLDPFMGSGTTAVAAEMLNRQWIGMEIAAEYVKQANERLVATRKHHA